MRLWAALLFSWFWVRFVSMEWLVIDIHGWGCKIPFCDVYFLIFEDVSMQTVVGKYQMESTLDINWSLRIGVWEFGGMEIDMIHL